MPNRAESVLKHLTPRAQKIYEDRQKLDDLLKDSEGKSRKFGIRTMFEDIKVLRQLLSDYRSGAYRNVSKSAIFMITAGLVYLVSPVDMLPDFILGLGFMDDAMILGYVVKQLYDIIDQYKSWRLRAIPQEIEEETISES